MPKMRFVRDSCSKRRYSRLSENGREIVSRRKEIASDCPQQKSRRGEDDTRLRRLDRNINQASALFHVSPHESRVHHGNKAVAITSPGQTFQFQSFGQRKIDQSLLREDVTVIWGMKSRITRSLERHPIRSWRTDNQKTLGAQQARCALQELTWIIIVFDDVVRDHHVIRTRREIRVSKLLRKSVIALRIFKASGPEILDEQAAAAPEIETSVLFFEAVAAQEFEPVSIANPQCRTQLKTIYRVIRVVSRQTHFFIAVY